MVAVGVTVWVPPVGVSAYFEPSLPVTTTLVALVAATVRVEELPDVTVCGFALIVTVGLVTAEVTVTTVCEVTGADPATPTADAV